MWSFLILPFSPSLFVACFHHDVAINMWTVYGCFPENLNDITYDILDNSPICTAHSEVDKQTPPSTFRMNWSADWDPDHITKHQWSLLTLLWLNGSKSMHLKSPVLWKVCYDSILLLVVSEWRWWAVTCVICPQTLLGCPLTFGHVGYLYESPILRSSLGKDTCLQRHQRWTGFMGVYLIWVCLFFPRWLSQRQKDD